MRGQTSDFWQSIPFHTKNVRHEWTCPPTGESPHTPPCSSAKKYIKNTACSIRHLKKINNRKSLLRTFPSCPTAGGPGGVSADWRTGWSGMVICIQQLPSSPPQPSANCRNYCTGKFHFVFAGWIMQLLFNFIRGFNA